VAVAVMQSGGVYMFANQLGCDGDRLYFDGCASVTVNGNCVAQGPQFAIREVVSCHCSTHCLFIAANLW